MPRKAGSVLDRRCREYVLYGCSRAGELKDFSELLPRTADEFARLKTALENAGRI